MIPTHRELHPSIHDALGTGRFEGRRGHRHAGSITTALYPFQAGMYRFKGGGGIGGIIKSVVIGAALGAIGGGIAGYLFGSPGTGLLAGYSAWEAGAITGAVSGGITGALGGIAAAIASKADDVSQASYQVRDNKLTVRNSVGPRKKIYGTALAGGLMVYATSTGSTHEYFHSVNVIATHQVQAIRETFFNNLTSTNSRFSGFHRINKHLGTQTQAADSDLVAEAGGEWTTAHRLRESAYIYPRVKYDTNAWVSGLPSTTSMVDGALYYDPRAPHLTLSVSSSGALGVFSTVGAHSFAAGDIVFILDHAGATYAASNGLSKPVTKRYTINTVPSPSTFTLLNDSGEPMPLLTSGSGGTVSKCKWSNNAALAILDYITSRDGINCRTSEVDWPYWEDAADIADEDVSLGTSETFTVSTSANTFTLSAGVGWQTGKQVFVSSSGTLPAPLVDGTAYYWIRHDETTGNLASSYDNALSATSIDLTDVGTGTHTISLSTQVTLSASADTVTLPNLSTYIETGDCVTLTGALAGTDYYWINTDYLTGKLATSRSNAMAGVAVDIASDETVRITRKNQARYTTNGIIDLSKKPIDILNDLLTACGGVMVYTQGKYRLFPAAPAASVKTIDQDDLRGSIKILPHTSRQTLTNAVRGTYKEPAKYWEMTDFPPLTNATYEAEDGGQRLYRDIALPHTIDPQRAQRIASIALGRARRGMVVNFPATVKMLGISAWDCVSLNLDIAGISDKKFRVVSWALAENGQGIDLTLNEEDDAVYEWSAGQGSVVPQSDLSNLPSPWIVPAPIGLGLTEKLYETRGSAGVKAKAILSWSDDGASSIRYTVARYRLEGSGDEGWTELAPVKAAYAEVMDIAPGVYEWQARHYNTMGAYSDWSETLRKEVVGLGAPPAAMQGLTISAISSMALLRWTQSTDLDVKIGGKVEFRHSPALVGATLAESTSIGNAIPGSDTVAVLPLKPGTYLARFVDSSGIPGPVATATTDGATVLAFSTVGSVNEAPLFSGTNSGTVVIGGALQLAGSETIDAITDFDATPNLDVAGGVASSGTYTFAAGIDLGSVQRVRLSSSVEASIVNVIDLIDDRTDDIDSWDSFDGTGAANADAVVYVRTTMTDPSASPVWSDWQRLDVAEFYCRAIDKPQLRMSTDDPAYNILVSQLSVTAETL